MRPAVMAWTRSSLRSPSACAANNVITGNAGNNVLAGLGGADTLDGGAGTDSATYAASAAGVSVRLATGLNSGGDAEDDAGPSAGSVADRYVSFLKAV